MAKLFFSNVRLKSNAILPSWSLSSLSSSTSAKAAAIVRIEDKKVVKKKWHKVISKILVLPIRLYIKHFLERTSNRISPLKTFCNPSTVIIVTRAATVRATTMMPEMTITTATIIPARRQSIQMAKLTVILTRAY